VGLGAATLWSASSGYALSLGHAPSYFIVRQFRYLPFALALFGFCALVPLDRLRAKIGPITLVVMATLFLPFIPGLGENRNGATRWISLGVATFQPSEVWKPVSILYLAHILDRRKAELSGRDALSTLIGPLFLVLVGSGIVFFQNDLSTAAIGGIAALAVFWLGSAPLSFFVGITATLAPLGALTVFTSDFRTRRILAFLYPAFEPHGQSYQVLGSIKAIQAGGLFGKGIGLGTLKLASIPAVQSDFVFAAYAEEMGFLGVLGFFVLWAVFLGRCMKKALGETDPFRSYLGFGLSTLLGVEVLVNVAMASGALPATGIPLPFFSAGGTSLLATGGIVGLLVNLSRPPAEARRGDV
jgi:cell division protein FtsW